MASKNDLLIGVNSRTTKRLELPFFPNNNSIADISQWISITCPYFDDTNEDSKNKLPSNLVKFFAQHEKNFCPMLVDDRSHVSCVVFTPDEDDDNLKPKNQKNELPFSQFYAGDFGVSFMSPSSSLLPKSCSILFLHSVLRLTKSSAEDNNNSGLSVFLSHDQEDSLSQPQKDFILKLASVDSAKIDFISGHLDVLVDLFLPIIDGSNKLEEAQSSESIRKSNIEIVLDKNQNDDGQEKNSPSHFFPPFISLDDMSELYDNHDLLDRLLFSYSLILTTFGWKIHNLQDGTVDRNGKTWKEVYAKFENREQSLVVKVMTRVLRSLIEFRLKKIAKKFIQFIWEELCHGRLQFLREVWEFVWVPMVLVKGYYRLENENEDEGDKEITSDSCCRWHFDEAQRESWIKKLKEIERGSSDDDE